MTKIVPAGLAWDCGVCSVLFVVVFMPEKLNSTNGIKHLLKAYLYSLIKTKFLKIR